MKEETFTVKHIIPSRGRAALITTHHLIDAVVVCPESEERDYRSVLPAHVKLDTVPDKVEGLAAVRNYIISNYKEKAVIMYDDDITKFAYMGYDEVHQLYSPARIKEVMESIALCADDAGVKLFGVAPYGCDLKKYKANQPFTLASMVYGIVGVIGKEMLYDERNKLKPDIDFTLQNLLQKRIVWIDARYQFKKSAKHSVGGSTKYNTEELISKGRTMLKAKWGKHIQFKSDINKTSIIVPRQQTIEL